MGPFGDLPDPVDDVTGTPVVPDPEEDPNEYSYVVNKFQRIKGQSRWNHQAVTDYLTYNDAMAWIDMGGPRA